MNNNKGMAMLIVISLVLMLLILGGTVLMISTGHFSTSHHQIARTKAYYVAEAATTHVFWALRTGQIAPAPPIARTNTLLPGDFEVNGITEQDIYVTIGAEANGVYPIEVEVTY